MGGSLIRVLSDTLWHIDAVEGSHPPHHPGQAKREPGTQKSWRTIPDKASPSPDDGGGDPPAAGKPRALSEGG